MKEKGWIRTFDAVFSMTVFVVFRLVLSPQLMRSCTPVWLRCRSCQSY